MGWEEQMGELLRMAHKNPTPFETRTLMAFLMHWSSPDRIALARELLQGTGVVLATKSPDIIIAEAPDYVQRPLLVEITP